LTAPQIKALALRTAREAGASEVRVCAATPDERARERMSAGFAAGRFATWPYDAAYAARATTPEELLPGARSVICVALSYATPRPAGRPPLSGRVSNYAWAHDYHGVLRTLLARIASALDDVAGAPVTRVACDTAPLAERAFAERSGLGWAGKHTNLIAPQLGSYVFLGEVVTTLALEPDEPLAKTCGNCTRCVDVCPTGALLGDYTIDATRCISDLTQRSGPIPLEMRVLIGDWVWGCDLCQDVCPPTQRGATNAAPAFAAQSVEAAFPDLQALLALRSGDFKRRYARGAMGWRGAVVLRRNAAVALGNSLDRAAVPALERALAGDPHPLVRGHAAWALGRIGSPRALAALRGRLAAEPDDGARAEMVRALLFWETFEEAPALFRESRTPFPKNHRKGSS
jgi:epoxyqueuosine reductase